MSATHLSKGDSMATLFALPRISPENCPALFSVPSAHLHVVRASEPPPLPDTMILWASPVQSVSAWRKQAKAEKGAGFTSNQSRVLIKSFQCSICSVWIGKNHTEQELYLLPVVNQDIRIRDDPPERPTHFDYALLYACGDCARRRQLPESHLVVPASTWETVTVLTTKRIQPAIEKFEQKVLPALCTQWGVSYETVMAHFHPLHLVPSPLSTKPGQAHVQPEVERREEKREEKAPLPPSSLSSLFSSRHLQLPRLSTFTQAVAHL